MAGAEPASITPNDDNVDVVVIVSTLQAGPKFCNKLKIHRIDLLWPIQCQPANVLGINLVDEVFICRSVRCDVMHVPLALLQAMACCYWQAGPPF
ncbi:hypothetical protein D3C86_1848140 [compost metagenome]